MKNYANDPKPIVWLEKNLEFHIFSCQLRATSCLSKLSILLEDDDWASQEQ